MNYPVYITHELIMETSKFYRNGNNKKYEQDFININSIRKTALGKFTIVEGTVHLYGYKIAGDGFYSGFYDVINQRFYSREDIKNATIIEHESEYTYDSPVKPKKLKKKKIF